MNSTLETARQILVTLALGATSDPLSALTYLLERYLEEAQELLAQHQLAEEERAQQNETLGILAETAERSDDPEQQGLYQQVMTALRQMQADEH